MTDQHAGQHAGQRADSARRPIRRALVSVSDKTGLADLGGALQRAGVEVVSTGSTAKTLAEAGVPAREVSEVTGAPEILDGRVKTLHPAIHAGLLADPRRPDHLEVLAGLGVTPFDLLVVNLYPFERTVAAGAPVDECIEQIDVGGPAMVRAAAKNAAAVAVVVRPERYGDVVAALADGGFTAAQRRELAAEAFAATAAYDLAIATWYAQEAGPDDGAAWPAFAGRALRRTTTLRYGENPHQPAALYADPSLPPGIAQARHLHGAAGKEMSFNNYVDADAAVRAAFDHAGPCVAVVKHANPCGVAIGEDIADAHRKAVDCDPLSAFGGVVAANEVVTGEMAAQVADIFTEVVAAPGFEDIALEILTARPGLRLLEVPPTAPGAPVDWRQVGGGVLVQHRDRIDAPGDDPATWRLVAGEPADEATLRDLAFAWRACRAVRSNAILIAKDQAAIGIGMGQVNRVDAARIAVWRGGEERVRDAVAASDAFFPFPDGLEVLTAAGVRAVVQPGGSRRDEEVIAAAAATGTTLYLTGVRHFAH